MPQKSSDTSPLRSPFFSRVTRLACILLLSLPGLSFGQYGSLRVGAEYPLQYSVGFSTNPEFPLSLQGNAGILSRPFIRNYLDFLSSHGLDDNIVSMVKGAFSSGSVFDAGVNLNIGKGYIGVYGQMIRLSRGKVPLRAVEDYFDIDLTPYILPGTDPDLALESTIYQAGVRLGRRFTISGPNLELQTELSFSKNFDSRHTVTSGTPYPASIETMVEDALHSNFRKYFYLPALGVYLAYTFR